MAVATFSCVFAMLCSSAGLCEDKDFTLSVVYEPGVAIAEMAIGLAEPFPVAMTDAGLGPLVFHGGGGIFSPVLLTVQPSNGAALVSLHPGLLGVAYSGAGSCSRKDGRT